MVYGTVYFQFLNITRQRCAWTHLFFRPACPWVHKWVKMHLLFKQRVAELLRSETSKNTCTATCTRCMRGPNVSQMSHWMQNSLFKLFEHKCVYNPNTQCFFVIPILKSPFSNQAVLRFLSEWRSSVQAPPTIVDWQVRLTLAPPRVNWELSASGEGKDKMSQIKRLKCFVDGCNNEHSSRQLLLTSEPLKTQRINTTFVLKWMRRSPIYINASMFVRIIRDPASSTEEVSVRLF